MKILASRQFWLLVEVKSDKRYTDEFNFEPVKHITEHGHVLTAASARLYVSSYSFFQRLKRYSAPAAEHRVVGNRQTEIRRLKGKLKRISEQRDILKTFIHS